NSDAPTSPTKGAQRHLMKSDKIWTTRAMLGIYALQAPRQRARGAGPAGSAEPLRFSRVVAGAGPRDRASAPRDELLAGEDGVAVVVELFEVARWQAHLLRARRLSAGHAHALGGERLVLRQ